MLSTASLDCDHALHAVLDGGARIRDVADGVPEKSQCLNERHNQSQDPRVQLPRKEAVHIAILRTIML
jgi:hypothetical protein